ncbi:hypothetical protein CPB83DRAFT_950783 [Crepidotus variabilis]|uniref:Chromatin modification-related protein n=1 Tax=Crepidotus variabilis TaxID=179855 RepID=A0A9P6JUD2_9AGAR|nr:hypothetical protein CPB83DRAFT_950783 [Crepidotus variabilis]
MSTRKRRHQEAFKEKESSKPPSLTEQEKEKQRVEKEQEIWDSIREAHYEAIEQLPLTLQRQLSLMRQIDEQTSSTGSRLLPTLQKYIELRRQLEKKKVLKGQDALSAPLQEQAPSGNDTAHIEPDVHRNSEPPVPTTMNGLTSNESKSAIRNTTPSTTHSDRTESQSSRDVIRQIAFMAEELLRASQEKVNLAQTNCDSVERHIHLLDRAIEEQEAALSADPNKAIHIHLPELIIPQNNRGKPKEKQLDYDSDDEVEEVATPVTVEELTTNLKRSSGRKGKGAVKTPVDGNDATSLTITLPAQSNEEPLYCYCQRVSFGEMIACDNSDCEREWFHLGCVGLTEPPEGEWFCEDCNSDEA